MNVDLLPSPIFPDDHEQGHEFNPGDCQTTMVNWNAGNPELADWEPLMDDPAALDPEVGASHEADNYTLALLDRRVEILRWHLNEDGGADVQASDISGNGPVPLPGTRRARTSRTPPLRCTASSTTGTARRTSSSG